MVELGYLRAMKSQKTGKLFAILFCLFSVSTQTVAAAQTSWQVLTPGAEIRLITSNKLDGDGFVWAAIEISLDKGFKTYWQNPGETGIPMQIDWAAAQNVRALSALWPFPTREESYGFLDYVYYDQLNVPLKLQLEEGAQRAVLDLALFLGVCSDVCIPVKWQGRLEIDLAKPSFSNAFRVQSALVNVPAIANADEALFRSVSLDAENNVLEIKKSSDERANTSLIVDLPHSSLLFGLPHSRPESDLLSVESLGKTDLSTLVGEEIRLIYDSERGPFEQLIKIELLKKVD